MKDCFEFYNRTKETIEIKLKKTDNSIKLIKLDPTESYTIFFDTIEEMIWTKSK